MKEKIDFYLSHFALEILPRLVFLLLNSKPVQARFISYPGQLFAFCNFLTAHVTIYISSAGGTWAIFFFFMLFIYFEREKEGA